MKNPDLLFFFWVVQLMNTALNKGYKNKFVKHWYAYAFPLLYISMFLLTLASYKLRFLQLRNAETLNSELERSQILNEYDSLTNIVPLPETNVMYFCSPILAHMGFVLYSKENEWWGYQRSEFRRAAVTWNPATRGLAQCKDPTSKGKKRTYLLLFLFKSSSCAWHPLVDRYIIQRCQTICLTLCFNYL